MSQRHAKLTRHVFFALPGHAEKLKRMLRIDFPRKDFRVVAGNCNETHQRCSRRPAALTVGRSTLMVCLAPRCLAIQHRLATATT